MLSKLNKQNVRCIFTFFIMLSSQIFSVEAIYSYTDRLHPVVSSHGMVATQEARATRVGVDVLKAGGNAVDAAVAVGYALAVTLPRAGNLGGGGFMMIYDAKTEKTVALDFREKAPMASYKTMFLNKDGDVDTDKSRHSLWAVGVPGTVYGLDIALEKFGTMSRSSLMEPAISLAQKGITVNSDMALSLEHASPYLKQSSESSAVFMKNGETLKEGDMLVQAHLARSLRLISDHGRSAFYDGDIADKFVSFMEESDGLISKHDLQNYEAVFRDPIIGEYKGFTIATMPPPSSGGIHLVQMLEILNAFDLPSMGHNTAESIHYMVEAMKFAYADRSEFLGDSDFVDVPVAKLISSEYAKTIASKINVYKPISSSDISPGRYMEPVEGNETTHFSIIDKEGNMVSCTYTLNFSYGNKIAVPGTGILLNNQMDDFSAKPGEQNAYGLIGGEFNAIESGKRMLSSMTPTLVFKDNQPFMATGSPGGSRIITTVLQLLLNVIDYDLNIAEASTAPRIHHQWYPDEIRIEKGLNRDTIRLLEKEGYVVVQKPAMGSTQSVMLKDHRFYGASDPRKPGALSLGY
jgi:gamma-glutamyltranspeptidase / glutathione hydrolase